MGPELGREEGVRSEGGKGVGRGCEEQGQAEVTGDRGGTALLYCGATQTGRHWLSAGASHCPIST